MNTSAHITIQEITDREQWNTFVSQQKNVHLMQTYEWGELNQYLGARVYRLGALENNQLVGIMQLLVVTIPLPVIRLNYLYCIRGPILADPDAPTLAALIQHAQEIARKEHAVVLRIDPNIADDDPQAEAWLQAFKRLGFQVNTHTGVSRRSWVLNLSPSAETLLANFKMTWRQNVRSAQRKGVIIREATTDADFDAYYKVLSITSERDDFLIRDKDYHKQIFSHYQKQGQAVLFLAEHEGEAIATKMLIKVGDWCWDMFGGSSNQKRNLKATYLIQYQCFLWAKEHGCTYFDFRAIPNILKPGEEMWGVYEFKKGFDGFSRLVLNTQDYVYKPLVYRAWNGMIEYRRARRHKEREKLELARVARGQNQATAPTGDKAVAPVATPPKVESTK